MRSNWRYYRLFEILPGAIAWTILLAPVLMSFYAPKPLAIILIFYLTFWLTRTFFMSYRLILGYLNYHQDIKINWLEKVKQLPPNNSYRDIYHLVIVPTYKEDIQILESSIESVINSNYDKDRIIYVLATEERDYERAREYSDILTKKYKNSLADYIAIMHPKNMPNEVKGKGPNITFACEKMVSYFEKRKIDPKNVIVTNMDSDNMVDKNYLACVTYKYLIDPDPVHKSFQPLPMYFNNIWDVPMAMRLIAMGSSAWQMVVATRPSRLRNFSAHAQSLEALIATNFWSKETIVEDGHQYWRSYYRFNGLHDVVPIFTPIYQDAVLADNLIKTIKEQYLQKRRWSWGVSDIPFVMEHTFKNKRIHWFDKWANALILWEAHISWSTASLVLLTSSWLPLVLNPDFKQTLMAFYFPIIYSRLLAIAWVGMIITLTISTLLVPHRRGKKPAGILFWDWVLTPIALPITNIIFSSIPALMSQTFLMIGRREVVFRVTVKSTKRSSA